MATPGRPFIDGEFRAASGERHALVNPATEETWAEIISASLDDVDRAVKGARRAFEQDWRDLTPRRRADVLFAICRLIRSHDQELAALDVQSIGKPITDAREEVAL